MVTSVSGENNPAAVWPNETNDHVKAGRLAGAILAQQADDLALPDVQFDPVHDRAAAVDLDQVVRQQDFGVLVRVSSSAQPTRARMAAQSG